VDVIRNLSWVEIIDIKNETLKVRVDPGLSAELNRLFVINHVKVTSFYPHRTLEEFFLKITEGNSEI
jgi:hypothetical protein